MSIACAAIVSIVCVLSVCQFLQLKPKRKTRTDSALVDRLRQCIYRQQGLFEQHLHCTVSHTWQLYIGVGYTNVHWLNIQQALASQQKQLGSHAGLH